MKHDDRIQEFLTRGVENIYPSKAELEKALASGKKLTIYFGIDPTAPTFHIGHGSVLLKLRELQDMGHKIILLIGDFTGMIGDPTDKTAARKQLTRDEVKQNMKQYVKQAGKILDMKKVEVKYNSKWLGKLGFKEILDIASEFTVQQMLARDMFEVRLRQVWEFRCDHCGKSDSTVPRDVVDLFTVRISTDGSKTTMVGPAGLRYACTKCKAVSLLTFLKNFFPPMPKPIYLHEFLYPLMQGYDSVAMNVDMEIGGNDQTFNMLVGRDMMKHRGKEKFVLTAKLLVDPTGKKMGKTEGNMVTLADSAEEMYGKVMSWPDSLMMLAFEICTRVPMDEAKSLVEKNPRDAKMRLAREIVAMYHSEKSVCAAEENFVRMFQKHEAPEEVVECKVKSAKCKVADLLVETKLAASKSEARRLVGQKGVKVDERVVEDPDAVIEIPQEGVLIQKGKRYFVRVVR